MTQEICTRLKEEGSGMKDELKKVLLEEIGVFLHTKQPSFLRYFGFVNCIAKEFNSLDSQTQEYVLMILRQFAKDEVLAEEISVHPVFRTIREMIAKSSSKLCYMALRVYELVVCSKEIKIEIIKFTKKVE
jgi:hypothetical protein